MSISPAPSRAAPASQGVEDLRSRLAALVAGGATAASRPARRPPVTEAPALDLPEGNRESHEEPAVDTGNPAHVATAVDPAELGAAVREAVREELAVLPDLMRGMAREGVREELARVLPDLLTPAVREAVAQALAAQAAAIPPGPAPALPPGPAPTLPPGPPPALPLRPPPAPSTKPGRTSGSQKPGNRTSQGGGAGSGAARPRGPGPSGTSSSGPARPVPPPSGGSPTA